MVSATEWSGEQGKKWAETVEAMDRQLAPATGPGMKRLAPRPGERIIDLGCGGGPTSLELARLVGQSGRVLGLDISPDLLAVARARAEGVGHLAFAEGDAARHAFEPAAWDALYSRFGTMFFDDPPAALAHLREALVPGGRAVLTVWAEPKHNLWAMLPANAASEVIGPAEKQPPGAPGPFGWATSEIFLPILEAAGWEEIDAIEHDIEMELAFGSASDPVTRAVELACRIGPLARRLREAPEAEAELRRVLAGKFAEHVREDKVMLAGRIRTIRARAS